MVQTGACAHGVTRARMRVRAHENTSMRMWVGACADERAWACLRGCPSARACVSTRALERAFAPVLVRASRLIPRSISWNTRPPNKDFPCQPQ
eukprot:6180958-Pleurochrysis_carterae.AAC.4